MKTVLRPAHSNEAAILSDIALGAKAHWGYDETFMSNCRGVLTITPDQISHGSYVVSEQDGKVVGFYQVTGTPPAGVLAHLWVSPSSIEKGIGRLLWQDALGKAAKQGFEHFCIEADPYAEGFYLKMGAVRVGEVASEVIPGRRLPLMKINLSKLVKGGN